MFVQEWVRRAPQLLRRSLGEDEGTPSTKALVAVAGVLWIAGIALGFPAMASYANTAGEPGSPPAQWPPESPLARIAGQPTLILTAHPRCPCTRASLAELRALIGSWAGRVQVHVLFVKPDGVDGFWEQSDLWRDATSIPGVAVHVDPGGREADRFGARTSGNVLVYGADGFLAFNGGITRARGHLGDNPGRRAVESLMASQIPGSAQTPVFGCPLHDAKSRGER